MDCCVIFPSVVADAVPGLPFDPNFISRFTFTVTNIHSFEAALKKEHVLRALFLLPNDDVTQNSSNHSLSPFTQSIHVSCPVIPFVIAVSLSFLSLSISFPLLLEKINLTPHFLIVANLHTPCLAVCCVSQLILTACSGHSFHVKTNVSFEWTMSFWPSSDPHHPHQHLLMVDGEQV